MHDSVQNLGPKQVASHVRNLKPALSSVRQCVWSEVVRAESWVHLAVVASSAAASQQVAFKALERREILLIPD